MNRPIWEGVYATFKEVPAVGLGYDDEASVRRCLERAEEACTPESNNRVALPRLGLLAVVAATVAAARGSVRILDFGGGLGLAYAPVRESLPQPTPFRLDVVEGKRLCEAGRDLFKDQPDVCFHEELETVQQQPDIIHLGSALHYVEDWRGLLRRLSGLRPAWLLVTDLPAGSFQTYATAQNYYDSRIPVWFFNLEELLQQVASCGFALAHRGISLGRILGEARELPQANFPEALRVGWPLNLVFARRQDP